MTSRFSAPQPSVVHLVTLFRQIAGGELRIPAFQREYVWTEKQVISLLDSVLEGFPIGSLLFWRVDHKILEVAPRTLTAFPDVPDVFPVTYVLDGMQRLTTLYGVFYYSDELKNKSLDVVFDLRLRKFRQASNERSGSLSVPLSTLFSPKKLLDFQSRLSTESDGDTLIDTVLKLQAAFQEYMIPTVTIQSLDTKRVVGIFERVNSTGTRLNSVDFMRAITWSTGFDLSKKIDTISAELSEFDWRMSSGTIIKCVALTMDMDVSSEALVNIRDKPESELHTAFDNVVRYMKKTADFLRDNFRVYSPDVISYEGQLLAAFLICFMGGEQELRDDFIRWFWACGLNEQLRGKPDDYVAKILRDWRHAGINTELKMPIQPNFTDRDFLTRRLQAGAALTNTFKMMHANNHAADIWTKLPINVFEYMSSSSTSQFINILNKSELENAVGNFGFSTKIYCNSILVDSNNIHNDIDPVEQIINLLKSDSLDILRSQFISPESAKFLERGEHSQFLQNRSKDLSEFGRSLLI